MSSDTLETIGALTVVALSILGITMVLAALTYVIGTFLEVLNDIKEIKKLLKQRYAKK